MQTTDRPFTHRRAGHCGSGAFRDLLEHHGLSYADEPLSEGAAFGLGGGLGFSYVPLPGFKPPVYLVGRTAGMERDVCEHLGIEADLHQTDDPDEGWAVLKAELDAGRPTMVWADIKHLEYLRVRMHNTRHDIVVCGYDADEGTVLVADNDRDELQRCSLESLARARASEAFPAPVRHATWLLRFPEALPEPAVAVRRGLDRVVANMTGLSEPLLRGVGASGLEGVDAFAREYPEWPSAFGGESLPDALRGLGVFIVKAGTGGAMFRSLHARFLHDAAGWLADDGLAALAATYDELAGTWERLAAVLRDGEPGAAHAAGAPLVARIAELEHRGVRETRDWLAAG